MVELSFMENLLALEAETKYLLSARDRSYEQKLKHELSRIFEEAELLFGPRDSSYELPLPRISECATARTYVLRPLRIVRIFLTKRSRTIPWLASLELAHEAIHVLSPKSTIEAMTNDGYTILEEGLAEWFAERYVKRVHKMSFTQWENPKWNAIEVAVSTLLSKNEFVVRDLRTRQPVISKIDEKLLVEVGGIESSLAKFLCTDFQDYWREFPWMGFTINGAHQLLAYLRSVFGSDGKID